MDAATDSYLADPTVVRFEALEDREARFTTESLLTCERAIIDGARRRRNEQSAVISGEHAIPAAGTQRPALDEGQAAAVRALTSSGHGTEVVSALAGTGKTR